MKNKMRKGSVVLLCIAIAAGAVSLVIYLIYAGQLGKVDVKVVLGLVVGILCGISQIFVVPGMSTLAMSTAFSITTFYFITLKETIGSYADYFSNIVAFGHSDLIGHINVLIIVLLVSSILAIVSCFCPEKEKNVKNSGI